MESRQYEKRHPHRTERKSQQEQQRRISSFHLHWATLADNSHPDVSQPYSMQQYDRGITTTSDKRWDTSWQSASKQKAGERGGGRSAEWFIAREAEQLIGDNRYTAGWLAETSAHNQPREEVYIVNEAQQITGDDRHTAGWLAGTSAHNQQDQTDNVSEERRAKINELIKHLIDNPGHMHLYTPIRVHMRAYPMNQRYEHKYAEMVVENCNLDKKKHKTRIKQALWDTYTN